MSDPVCDPYAGWGGLHNTWSHCRGGEDACLTVELLTLTSAYAYVGIETSWGGREGRSINKGSYIEYDENGTIWRVYCDGLVTSMEQANIRICYTPSETPPDQDIVKVGDTVSVDGHTFQLLDLVCGTNARIVARIDGALQSTKLKFVAGSLLGAFPLAGVAVGGLYVGIKTIGGACSLTLDRMAGGGLDSGDVDEMDRLLEADYTRPDDTKPTPEELHVVKMKVLDGYDWTDPWYVDLIEKLVSGQISREEFERRLMGRGIEDTKTALDQEFHKENFTLVIPCIVLAGDVEITGTAPQPNQVVKIMAVKKFLGFDWAAVDQELASPQSDSNYEYYDTIALNEFGMIEVYGLIGKDWWAILDKDITTEKHTVLVVTPMILLAILAMLAMVLDKKYNFIGMFKKKRGKK